jgi:hypothetical protein
MERQNIERFQMNVKWNDDEEPLLMNTSHVTSNC